jgi:hypothetical protein
LLEAGAEDTMEVLEVELVDIVHPSQENLLVEELPLKPLLP